MQKEFHKDDIQKIAQAVLGFLATGETATVVTLSGDLGAGKTTLTQAIARELGITENIISPTFVIMKRYELHKKNLIHIDAYRLESADELLKLGWAELIADPKNLILIEWPEKVAEIIPKNAVRVSLAHHAREATRTIIVE